jgi:glycosyltransferase involved in cell wall biosynthesis
VSRQIITVHDVAHLEHPEWYSWKFSTFYRWLLPRLVKRVALILTVSEFSKARILDLFGLPSEKVIVAPLGVDLRFAPSSEERVKSLSSRYGIDSPYLISVASVSERKNLRRVIEAWHRVGIPGVRLVIVGAKGLPFAGKSDLPADPSVMYLGYVADEDLPVLYSGALGAVYVSLYEGFGLPLLEAMACGVPVLTSNVTSLPEVAGGAALLVDPYDVEAITQGIRRIAQDADLRQELHTMGLERAKQFTWQRTADLTWQALQDVIKEG